MTTVQPRPDVESLDGVSPAPVPATEASALTRGIDHVNAWYDTAEAWLFEDKRALRGVALARILSGLSVLGILLTNFRVRNLMYGPASVWNEPMQKLSEYAPPRLVENLGNTAFLIFYVGVLLCALLFVLGWHTHLVGILMLVGEVAIVERNPVLGDQGDNILRIGLLLLMFMHTSQYWSLDARRRARTRRVEPRPGDGPGRVRAVLSNLWNSQHVLPRWLSNGIHNIFLAALMFQLVVIYISAGMFKVQGELWQHGTALYYPLQLTEYKPLPFLTEAMTHFGVFVGLATYVVVFTQLFFPLLLLQKFTRRVAICLILLFHLSIAVVMALPWFSLSMIAFDAVWISSSTLEAVDRWLRDKLRPVGDLFWDVVDPVVDRLPERLRR